MERARVLIAVTHLLGIGHLARMALLARALAAAGHAVQVVSGGVKPPSLDLAGLDLVQLPPVQCRDADFSTLFGPDGGIADMTLLEHRAALLAGAVAAFRPDVVITELYPFGRRALAAEFEALIAAAAALDPRPALLASLRDVLNPPAKPGRAEDVLARLARDYDAVLVHGDPAVLPLGASWPVTPALERRLCMVGYLHGGLMAEAEGPRAGILVSGGGSGAGLALYRHALAAAPLLPDHAWHLLVGHGVAEADFAALAGSAAGNVRVERARPDFPALLARAALSISQAGYNTVLDLAAAGPRAILVPFAEGREREQGLRAEALAARGLATVVEAGTLDGLRLAAAARAALAAPVPDWSAIRRDGAARAVAAVEAAAARARAR
ncbi:glycosyltransferase family protein, partial [Rhabdaerophilum calidifontis]|uniref:glycosyltransferase family protein n=1 Tax=Rhabdaerophilum calidifontis TaxID=2604328 RepID=UPI002482EEE9